MKIAIVSGKGGAGKTSIAVSLILARGAGVIVDCDVEEPNVALLLSPVIEGGKIATKPVPKIDTRLCDYCKVCAESCQFNALMVLPGTVLVFEKMCHSCGTCSYVCPKKAIHEEHRPIGEIEWGRVQEIKYIGGKLNVGEAMATPLITQVKEFASGEDFMILDAPPGTTCSAVEVMDGADFVLIVAESSPFGLADFQIVCEVVASLDVPFGVVENKAGMAGAHLIKDFCEKKCINFLASIPYDHDVARAYSEGIPIIKALSETEDIFHHILESVGA